MKQIIPGVFYCTGLLTANAAQIIRTFARKVGAM